MRIKMKMKLKVDSISFDWTCLAIKSLQLFGLMILETEINILIRIIKYH